MTSNEDRLEDTKHEIKNKLQQLARRLQIMTTLDKRQMLMITELNHASNSTEIGTVLIHKKNEDISKTQEILAHAEDTVKYLTLSCNDRQGSIQDEKVYILHMETEKTNLQKQLEQYRADRTKIEDANAVLKTQIQEVK